MKKTVKARCGGILALALACTGLLAMTAPAQAQVAGRYRRNTVSNASYQRMRQWARELAELADHANEQAQADQAGYRGFRRDTNFLKSIDHFARRAREFRTKMDSYRTRPWNVDEEIEHLLRDAREVQKRLQRARFVDRHTAEDWNQVVSLLNQTLNEYRSPGTYRGGRYGDDPNRRDDDIYRRDDGRYDDRANVDTTDIRQLARELEASALRVAQLSDRYGTRSGYSSEMRRFSDEVRDFRNLVDTRTFSRSELRTHVNRLLEEAQNAHDEMTRTRITSDVAAEWDRVVQVLDRMRALVV